MWREIKGYEGMYEINEEAVVRRLAGGDSSGRNLSTHIVLSSKTLAGSRYIALWKNGERKTFMLHRLYAAAFGMSNNEAARRIYKGFSGRRAAIHNVRSALLINLAAYEKEQAEGSDRKDEILYIKQFLGELEADMKEQTSLEKAEEAVSQTEMAK